LDIRFLINIVMLLMTEMAVPQDNYCRLLAEWHKRDDYWSTFRSSLGELAGKVDFSWVKSCVAFGTGSGDDEIEFARRLLPSLRAFTAVEFDPESVKALHANFRDGQLPGVETSVMETSLESWTGVGSPVDCVLLFNVFFHVKPEDRRAFFEKCYMDAGGVVVIIDDESADASNFLRLMKRLGYPEYTYKEIEGDILAVGYRRVLIQSIVGKRDLSNPSEDVVKFVELLRHRTVSHEEIRTAIAEIFSQPDLCIYHKRLAIFEK